MSRQLFRQGLIGLDNQQNALNVHNYLFLFPLRQNASFLLTYTGISKNYHSLIIYSTNFDRVAFFISNQLRIPDCIGLDAEEQAINAENILIDALTAFPKVMLSARMIPDVGNIKFMNQGIILCTLQDIPREHNTNLAGESISFVYHHAIK